MSKNNKALDTIIIIFLLAVIIVTVLFSFQRINLINRFNLITSYKTRIQAIISKNHTPLTIENTSLIDTWMTFRYINLIFKLPPDYLKGNLNISDKRYPNISLGGYIKNNKLDKTTFLDNVRKAVADYLTTK
jgi:hypothetical protein